MRLVIFTTLLFLTASSVACFAQEKGAVVSMLTKTDPSVTEGIYIWDIGKIREGDKIRYKFILKNDSDKTINISHVKTSCGCTASEIKDKNLAPQEETVLSVQFNSKGYSGNVQQYVYVHTDNPDNPILRFVVKAEVIKKQK